MGACENFRKWLATDGAGDPPPPHAAHVATCPACRRLATAYRHGVAAGQADTASAPVEVAGFRDVLDRIEGRQRRARLAWALPAAAAIAAIAWAGFLATRTPGPPSEGAVPQPPTIVQAPVLPPSPAVPATDGSPVVAPASGLDLQDDGIARLRLGPYARVRTDAWTPLRSVVAVESGTVFAEVRPRPPGGLFEVRTEYAVVRVIGTRFTVTHRPGIDTEVACEEGRVGVQAPDRPQVAFLGPGERLRLGPGLAPVPVAPAATPVPSTAIRPPAPGPARAPAAVATQPDPAETLARARGMLAEGRVVQALALLETASAVQGPGQARLLAVRGDAQRMAGRLEAAQASYEQAIAAGAPDGTAADLASMLRVEMGRWPEAVALWRRYLETRPDGRYAAQALWEIAAFDQARGALPAAIAGWGRIVDGHAGSPHAVRALVLGGRSLMDAGDLERAADWYATRTGHARPEIAEAALAGLIGVRARQGRAADVAALAAEYDRRFPAGAYRDEVRLVAP